MFKRVSLLVPVFNEYNFIEQLLRCISEQTYSKVLIEAVIIDGGSTDGTIEFIKSNIGRYEFHINILHNSKKFQCYGLNLGLEASRGEIIIRMDAHSEYEREYISKIVNYLEDKTVVNIGGVALAKGYDYMSCIIADVIGSPVCVGGARFRYSKKVIDAETVFPGAWRKNDLLSIKGWSEEWIINEDTELNLRLKKELKGRIVVDPDIKVSYFPRNSLKKLSKQYFSFGCWRIKTANAHPEALRYSHVAAMLSMPGFAAICICSLFSWLYGIYLLSLLIIMYFLIIITNSIYLNWRKRNYDVLKVILHTLCIFIIHSSWSIGSLAGLFRFGIPYRAIYKKISLRRSKNETNMAE